MPLTAGNLIFYEEQFETGVWLGLTQFIDAFNASSGNTILLSAGARKGRKPVETFIDDIAGLIQRRDPSGTGNLTPAAFSDSEHAAIKIFRSAPLTLTRQAWIDRGFNTESGTRMYGIQFGRQQAQDYLNTVISALVGSINAIGSSAVLDITGETVKTMGFDALNRGLGKMGDSRQQVRSLVTYSKPLTDLIGTAFSSQQIAFQVGGTTVFNGGIPSMGLQQILTDAPPLTIPATSADPEQYYSLALVPNAARVKTGPSNQIFSVITGSATSTPENHQYLLSIEWEFEIMLRGVSYTSATVNPNAATLADPASWTLVATNRKLGPGVMIVTQ